MNLIWLVISSTECFRLKFDLPSYCSLVHAVLYFPVNNFQFLWNFKNYLLEMKIVCILTYGKSNIWPYEWNERYNLMLLKLFTNCASAKVSGSEKALYPAKVSEHGFFDAPFSENFINLCKTSKIRWHWSFLSTRSTKVVYIHSNEKEKRKIHLHDEKENFDLRQHQYSQKLIVVFDFFSTFDSKWY